MLLLAACGAPLKTPVVAPVAPPPAVAAATAGAGYRLDGGRSELRILAYRSGPLARFGHNHVLLARHLGGGVRLAAPGEVAGAGFEVEFRAEDLVVDDPAARREEGLEFESEPTASDIAGTRRNLLGPKVLDAELHPTIAVRGVTVATPAGLLARVRIEVAGTETELEVPIAVTRAGEDLAIRGGFSVKQSALGRTPFSVGLGALAVRDELEVRFSLVAVPVR